MEGDVERITRGFAVKSLSPPPSSWIEEVVGTKLARGRKRDKAARIDSLEMPKLTTILFIIWA